MNSFGTKSTLRNTINVILVVSPSNIMKAVMQTASSLNEQHGIKVIYESAATASCFKPSEWSKRDIYVSYNSSSIPTDFITTPLHRDPFVAIVPKEHPLASQGSISMARDL